MNAPLTPATPRLEYLDGLRGWAALMVVLSHLLGQFARHNSDLYSSRLVRLVSDGHFAVLVFFVLSGTALSLRYTRRPQPLALGWLVAARYVRIVVPIAATTLIIFALMKLKCFGGADVAAAAHSPILLGPRHDMSTSLLDVASFSFFDVLFRYDTAHSFNTSLWTMPVEFDGSLLIYALLFAMSRVPSLARHHRVAIGGATAVACLLAAKGLLACFFGGYVLAELLYASPQAHAWGRRGAAALIALAAVLLAVHGELDDRDGALLATGVVMSVAFWPVLSRVFSSSVSRWLGAISFPLYLIHAAVIDCTGRLFLALEGAGLTAATATHVIVAIALPASLLAGRILMPVERCSIRWSHAVGKYRFGTRALATSPPR